jgi:N-acyl-D-aspartate/D-glutamate deacylase
MRNSQAFRGVPSWHPILLAADEEKLRAYSDPEVRQRLHDEVVEWKVDIPGNTISRHWYDYMWVESTVLDKNKQWQGKSIRELATLQGKGIIDAFLDLVVEEHLDTVFLQGENNVDKEAVGTILNYPSAIVGLSDGGAHVQFHGGYGYSTRLLGYWVREQQVMSLEKAVRRLTFESATTFGIFDRGLLRPGMAADVTIFDPATVQPLPEDIVHDFPAGGWRFRELASGIHYTIVNGQLLLEDGQHTGALPGRIVRNSLCTTGA